MRLVITGTYPTNWDELARAVKDSVSWRCVRCQHPFDENTGRALACDASCDQGRGRGSSNRLQHDYAREILTDQDSPWGGFNFGVHHLDGDRGNNRWWNLIPLDNSCHLYVQGHVIPERPWLFDHSTWFVPYICGFYAWYYNGTEISRAEADENPDRWLAFGQPWRYACSMASAGEVAS